MTFVRETTRRAFKPHRCDACQQMIAAGETYVAWAQVQDGEFGSGAYHPDCRVVEIEANHAAGIGWDEWTPLHEHVAECSEMLDDAPDAVRARFGLAPGQRCA